MPTDQQRNAAVNAANAAIPVGNNKAYAAIAAGAASTILVWGIDLVLGHYSIPSMPAEIVAAVQTLLSTAAVYFTPHGSA